ncbi:conserved hypothetical protein [Verticillium alfalfae VaMs.102]|uniref:Uncharacterized protein n=1 Tax=Verticillium alfalfae (strain VaMs.102 / ATCC MYA-4576 / FGSC 10136) TaxID=526221 RepID=C9S7I7_VERA1|nr:conserved hypothetical protein [Verticillium alfalfae VaMs.102]EEY14748.1 conserved hypothetical protein [Verticillium alfalfae VaMs.102]
MAEKLVSVGTASDTVTVVVAGPAAAASAESAFNFSFASLARFVWTPVPTASPMTAADKAAIMMDKRKELALRTAIFLSAAPLATAFASSLAFLIVSLAKNGPIAPWRLLFLLEGFPSVLIAPIAWRLIPDSPQTATYLTPRQRKVARLRLRNEETPPSPSSAADAASTSPQTSSTPVPMLYHAPIVVASIQHCKG